MKNFVKLTLAAGAATMAMASPAFADWYEIKTDQFIVYSAAKEKQAVEFAELMERYDIAMRITQNIPLEPAKSDARRVTIFNYGDMNDMGYLAYGRRDAGIGGFYRGVAGNPVAFSPIKGQRRRQGTRKLTNSKQRVSSDQILLHEYTHSFMFQHFPATYPNWYSEGFAEFYGMIEFLDDGSFHLGNPPQIRGDILKNGPSFHVKELFDNTDRLTGLERINWYAAGWLMVHYLTFEQERAGQLANYLRRIQTGESSLDAAKAAFGDLDQLNSDVRGHLRGQLPGYNVKPSEAQEPEIRAIRKLTAAEEDIIKELMELKGNPSKDRAEDVAESLRSTADLSSDSILVALTVAEAELRAENFDAAERAARRAIEIDPQSSKGHLFLGAAFAGRGEEMHDKEAGSGAEMFAKAREFYADAIAFDGDDPLPYFAYYMSYYDADAQPTEQALVALETAHVMAPYDNNIRVVLVRQLAREGKAQLTADVMTPLVFATHGNDDLGELREAMEKLRGGEETAGLTMIEETFRRLDWEREQEEDGYRAGLLHGNF